VKHADFTIIHANSSINFGIWVLGSFCVWSFLSIAFVLVFHAQEKTIFAWDWDNWPGKFRLLINTWNDEGSRSVIRKLLDSLENDYTLLPSFLLLPLGLVFGGGREVYLAGVASIYGFVAIAATIGLFLILCRHGGCCLDRLECCVAVISVAIMPLFWGPILRGFPDVFCMGIISGILCAHLLEPLWERPVWHLIILGVVIAGLAWFRRWTPYFVVAMIFSVIFDFVLVIRSHKLHWKIINPLALRGTIALGTAACILLAISPDRWLSNLLIWRGDLYSSYRFAFWGDIALTYYHYIGMMTLGIFGLGCFSSLPMWGLRGVGFVGVYLVSYFLLYQSTANFGPSHLYGILPAIFAFVLVGVIFLVRWIQFHSNQKIAAVSVVSLLGFQFATVTTPLVWRNVGSLRAIFSEAILPEQRHDLKEIRRLLETLKEQSNRDEKIYVLSSSYILNSDILKNAGNQWGYGRDLTRKILTTHDVDSRDGFPARFFSATLIVVAAPFQFHLPLPSEQRNVSLLFEKISNDIGFRSGFEQLEPVFNLDDKVKVSIYRLKRLFEPTAIQLLRTEYNQKKYADWKSR